MCKSRIHDLEARLDVLTHTLKALLAASTPEAREQVALGLQHALGTAADDDAVDAIRAGALWHLLGGAPHSLPQAASSP